MIKKEISKVLFKEENKYIEQIYGSLMPNSWQ